MKYECTKCANPCSIEANFEPTVCLKTGIICYGWHKVPAPAPKPLPVPKLPDWCKVGAWVYDETLRQYEQITEVNKTCFVTTHCTRYSATGLKPARVRPWTFEEAPYFFKTKDDVFVLLDIQDKREWGYWAKKECEEYTLAEVAKEQIQIDGSPCGVLEVAEVGK